MSQPSFRIFNQTGVSPVVIVCEHASHYIPSSYQGLGLHENDRQSHIAWDPGAAAVAQLISNKLDAPLVVQRYSRLLYDCNRPPESQGAIPILSEFTKVPGNFDLNDQERSNRIQNIYQPFHDAISQLIEAKRVIEAKRGKNLDPVLITIHSFTREFKSVKRALDIGIISDADATLSDAIISNVDAGCGRVRANEPYSATDGVTHTLQIHGTRNTIKNSMIEICNDRINDALSQHYWADCLSTAIESSLFSLQCQKSKKITRSSSNNNN